MSAKVRIKAGPVEFEYEGETEMSIDDIKDLFSHIETLFTVPSLASSGAAAEDGDGQAGEAATVGKDAVGEKLHINSVAAKMTAKSGTDVALAAAAHLQIVRHQSSFSRQELLSTMREASKYYKTSMSSNLTKSLNSLVGTKFNQVGQDQYSLTAAEHKRLEGVIA
jgi:hypothetical protein